MKTPSVHAPPKCELLLGAGARLTKGTAFSYTARVTSPAVMLPGLLLVLLMLCETAESAVSPPKLAGAARIDLNASVGTGSLTDGRLVSGNGSVERQTWLPAPDWPRTYVVHVPIVRFGWNAFELRFIPERTGSVQLSLRGPWEEVVAGSGEIHQQEVLWDALEATGVSIANGSFETVERGGILGWAGGSSQSATPLLPAVEGGRVARSWHNDSLTQTLAVTAGVPVHLRFHARARIPDGFADMKPVAGRNSPAHRAARRFARGVNFGNYLEIHPDTPGRLSYGAADFALARSEGFDHVRLPVAWQHYTGAAPGFVLSPGIFAQVDFMVTNALAQGLSVMLDVHNFDEFVRDPPALANKLYAIWEQVAAHYAWAPESVAFEILNEPRDAATTLVMNPIHAEAIRRIRLTNPLRTIFLGPGAFNGISELNHLILPDSDLNLIATVHTYDPFLFTHQGLPWAGSDAGATKGVVFPGPPVEPLIPASGISEWAANWITAYNTLDGERNPSSPSAFRGSFQFIQQWSEYYGRPVHVGEFGAFETADKTSRVNYYREKRRALDEAGLGWAVWDWKAGFHYIKDGVPEPADLREALFPPPELQSTGKGFIEVSAAIGKLFVIERADTLRSGTLWQPISTQQLAAPKFVFTDTNTNDRGAAFYRIRWLK